MFCFVLRIESQGEGVINLPICRRVYDGLQALRIQTPYPWALFLGRNAPRTSRKCKWATWPCASYGLNKKYLHIFMILHAPVPLRPEKEMDAPLVSVDAKSGVETYLWSFHWCLMLDCCCRPWPPSTRRIDPFQEMFQQHNVQHIKPSKLPLSPVSCRWCCSFSSGFSSWSGLDIQHVWRVSYPGFEAISLMAISLSL